MSISKSISISIFSWWKFELNTNINIDIFENFRYQYQYSFRTNQYRTSLVSILLRSQKLSKIVNRWKSATYAILQKQSHLFVISRSSRTFCTSTIKVSLFLVLILCWTFDFGEATRTFFCSLIVKGLTLWQTFTLLSLSGRN